MKLDYGFPVFSCVPVKMLKLHSTSQVCIMFCKFLDIVALNLVFQLQFIAFEFCLPHILSGILHSRYLSTLSATSILHPSHIQLNVLKWRIFHRSNMNAVSHCVLYILVMFQLRIHIQCSCSFHFLPSSTFLTLLSLLTFSLPCSLIIR